MARIPDPTRSPDPETQGLLDAIAQKRGHVAGMYRAMLNNPKLTKQVSDLGGYLRFAGELPDDVRELAILYAARTMGSAYEWVQHEPIARKAGVPAAIIEKVRQGADISADQPYYGDVLRAVGYTLDRKSVPQELHDRLAEKLGLPATVELIILTGFYEMIASFIFAFDIPLPENQKAPF